MQSSFYGEFVNFFKICLHLLIHCIRLVPATLHPKKTMKNILATLALSMPITVMAQTELQFVDHKMFHQAGPTTVNYLGGAVQIGLVDGSWVIAGCAGNGGLVLMSPNLACPLGTTGFITSGDSDRNGVNDDNSYWSVASLTPAVRVAPFLAEQIKILAAPPSLFERPQSFFNDASVTMWYNVLTQAFQEHNFTYYSFRKEFDNKSQQDGQVVYGVYQMGFPLLADVGKIDPPRSLVFSVTHFPHTTGYPGVGKRKNGMRVTNGRWYDGRMQLDPRNFNDILWSGVDGSYTIPSDDLRFSITRSDVTPWVTTDLVALTFGFDTAAEFFAYGQSAGFPVNTLGQPLIYDHPTIDALELKKGENALYNVENEAMAPDNIIFPPLGREMVLPAMASRFRLGPGFMTKGSLGNGVINYRRNIVTGNLSYDSPQTQFRFGMEFIDSFSGHSQREFPLGAGTKLRAPTGDYDGDGISNILEFAYSQDDGDDLSSTLEWTSFNQVLNRRSIYDAPPYTTPALLAVPTGFTAPVTVPVAVPRESAIAPFLLEPTGGTGPIPILVGLPSDGLTPIVFTTPKRKSTGLSITYGFQVTYDNTVAKPKWVTLRAPALGQTLVVKDTKAGALVQPAANSTFTWTISNVADDRVLNTTGSIGITASHVLHPKISIRPTASVSKGF